MADISDKKIRVRFPPSPTGSLHVGNVRTAVFNWLFARKYRGTLVLRIEDTDKERSKKEYETELLDGLEWLGIDWDEGIRKEGSFGPYRQSERTEIYKKYLNQLFAKGEIYYCYCTKEDLEAERVAMTSKGLPVKYSGRCRDLTVPPAGKAPEVIRFKVPEVKIEFVDMIRGHVSFDTGLLGDIVIAKDLDSPLYNFAVVIDDALMEITHVIRGEDHISNTPKQILLQRALGFKEPIYAHLPLLLNPDRSKMSKRFGDTALSEYRHKGYLPDAIVNFLALLGWHPKDDREVMSRKELVELFDIERVQKAGAVFSHEKLDWLNREYLKKMSDQEIANLLEPIIKEEKLQVSSEALVRMVAVGRGRASTLRDFIETGRFFFDLPDYPVDLLVWQKKPSLPVDIAVVLRDVQEMLEKVSDEFNKEELSVAVNGALKERQKGEIFWPLRVALSGQASSPDPIDIMNVLGKKESLRRIEVAIEKCNKALG